MTGTFEVIQRSPAGQPRRIRCVAHEGCSWQLSLEGARRDDDPILLAQFNRHLHESETTERRDLGRARRKQR
jgi:hypothetical protein